jgi:hypothetical protein
MNTRDELERVRRRVDRLEAEVGEARRQLDVLERQMGAGREAVTEVKGAECEQTVTKGIEERVTPPPLPPPLPPKVPIRVPEVRAKPEEPAAVRVWLERLQLWPPAADAGESAEARLGAWWATRIGALLAVVGVVFFGIHVSRHTPAWVKFGELLIVAGGVTALGRWIARRLPAFGEVVFASGLALFFFAAYAGHAVAAVRVFPELWMSVLAQAAAVAGIVATALARRSAMIATLATGLGFVTAFVSSRGGLDGYALGAAAMLSAMAVALRRWRGWEGPSVVALPGAYAVFGLGLLAARAAGAEELAAATWPFLVGVAGLFFARDWRGGASGPKVAEREETWFQSANSSLAAACGVAAALGWFRAELEWFYLGAAALFAAGAWARTRQGGVGDPVAAVLTAKATGALTLAVIEIAGARDAAVALLVHAWVLAWLARRLGSRVLAAGTGLVAGVATWFFFTRGLEVAALWSAATARTAVFALGLAGLATEAGRWLVREREARGMIETAAAALVALGLFLAVGRTTSPTGWGPAVALGWAGIFTALWWARRGAAAAWVAASLASAAQVWLWVATSEGVAVEGAGTLAWNAIIVVGVTAGAGALMKVRAWAATAWALAVVGAVLSLFALWAPERAMLASAVGALVIGVAAGWVRGRCVPWIATLGLGLGVACWFGRGLDAGAVGWVGGAAVAAWALPAWLRASARAGAAREAEPLTETMERLQVLAGTVLGLRAVEAWLEGGRMGVGFAVAGLAVFGLAVRPGVRPALVASWVFWAACVLAVGRGDAGWWVAAAVLAWVPAVVWERRAQRSRPTWNFVTGQAWVAGLLGAVVALEVFAGAGELLALAGAVGVAAWVARPGGVGAARIVAGVLGAGAAVLAMGEIFEGGAGRAGSLFGAVLGVAATLAVLPLWLRGRRGAAYAGGGGALAVAFMLFVAQRGGLAPYATVGWGLAAILIFMAGLFLRVAPYRVLGLLGLAACVPRVFLVDLNSTLHRIVAFIALGVVLLWVGFSYHRFKHLLVADPETAPDFFSRKQ